MNELQWLYNQAVFPVSQYLSSKGSKAAKQTSPDPHPCIKLIMIGAFFAIVGMIYYLCASKMKSK